MSADRSPQRVTAIVTRRRTASLWLGAAVILGMALVHGCRVARKPVAVPTMAARAWTHFLDAERSRREGRFSDAADAYGLAVEVDDRFVRAHRRLQNHKLRECLRADVMREYRSRMEANPESAIYRYLWGRIQTDPDRQEADFRATIELDEGFEWGHYGLGVALQRKRRFDAARQSFERVLEIDPAHDPSLLRLAELAESTGDRVRAISLYVRAANIRPDEPDVHLALADALSRDERPAPALRSALVAVRLAPWSSAVYAAIDDFMPAGATAPDLLDLADLLDELASDEERAVSPRLFLTRARVARRLGDPIHARMLIEQGLEAGGDAQDFAEERRKLSLIVQDYAGALEAWRTLVPDPVVLDPESVYADRFEALIAELSRTDGAQSHLDRARVMERVGWLEGALQEYRLHLLSHSDDDAAWESMRELEAHQDFVDRLEREIRAGYLAHASGEPAPTLESFLDDVRTIGEETLGRDVTADVAFEKFPFMGSLMIPGFRRESELTRQFDRYGQIAVVGRQVGAPPEVYIAPVLQLRPQERVALGRGDRDPTYARVLARDVIVPSYREFRGSRIAGVALGEWMLISFDVVRRWQRSAARSVARYRTDASRLLDLPIEPTRRDDDRSIVQETSCVDRKLYLRAYEEGPEQAYDSEMLLDVVLAHEYGHLIDFHRFVPISSHLARATSTLVRLGFSRARVEEYLEENAQLVAVAASSYPFAALAQTVTPTSEADDAPPHTEAYHRISKEWLRYVKAHLDDYPQLDPGLRLEQQLHRLDADEIRDVARILCRRRGLTLPDTFPPAR